MRTNDEREMSDPQTGTPELTAQDERFLDGDFIIEGDSGGTDNGSQTQIVPPPRPPES